MDKHRRCVSFRRTEWCRPGARVVECGETTVRFTAKYHILPKPRARTSGSRSEPEDVYTSIDPILDKISKSGIGSLTASERRQLDRERERLLKNSE